MASSPIAQVIIKAVDQASSVLSSIAKAGKETAEAVKSAFESVTKAGQEMSAVGLAGLGAFGAIAKSVEDYNEAVRNTLSMTGAIGEEYDKLGVIAEDLAQKLSVDLATDSKQIMQSFYYVLSTGAKMGSEQFEKLSETAIKFSKIANKDVSWAVENLADITKIFGKETSEADRTANILFRSSQLGNTDLTQLAEAMKKGGTSASSMGVSMETASAILTQFAERGIKGSEAGEGLKQILLRLGAPSKEAMDALGELGVTVYKGGVRMRDSADILKEFKKQFKDLTVEKQNQMFEDFGLSLKDSAGKSRKFKDLYNELMTKIRDSNGNIMPDALVKMNEMGIATTKSAGKMRPIIDVLRDIQKSTAKMSEEQKNAVLKALAGEEAYGKLNALLSTNMDTTQKWAEELKTTNVVNDAFAKYLETFTAQFTILKAKFEPVVKIIGGKFLENMAKVIKQITPLVDKIREWVKAHPKLTEQIVLFSTAVLSSLVGLGSFLVVIGSIGTKIGSLIGFLSSLLGGLGAIGSFLAANPIALWIAGIITALGTLYLAWTKNWGNIQGVVNKFLQETGLDKWINGIVESFMHLYDNISPYITLIQEALGKVFSIAGGEGSIEEKMNKIKGVFAGLLKDFQPVIDGVTGFVNKAVEEIMKLYYTIEPYILMIPDVFNKVWNDITTSFNNFVNEYKPAWDGLWEYALKLLTELWAELQPLITDIQKFVQDEWAKFNSETLPQLQVFFDAVIQEWNALKPIILPIVNLLMSGIMLAIKTYLSKIISDLKILWNAFKVGWDIFTWVLNNLIIPGMTAIAMSITQIINVISDAWTKTKELWKKYIAEPWDYFLKLINSVTPTIVSAVAKLMESIWNSLKKYYLQMSAWFDSTFGEMLGTLQALQQIASGGTSFNLSSSSGTTSASDTTSSSGSAKLSRSLSSATRSASSSASAGSKTFIVNGNIYGGDAGLRELNRLLRQYGFEEDARGVI